MPRFLGRDYLAEALRWRKAVLDKHLLLEKVEGHVYVHTGVLPDGRYRKPWFKAKRCLEQVGNSVSDIDQEFRKLVGCNNTEVEPFSSSPSEKSKLLSPASDGCGYFEIIPSSNPDSQSSLDDDILEKLQFLVFCDNNKEKFKKEDISNYAQEEISSDILIQELEYFEVTDLISELKPGLPPLRKMLDRLNFIPVPDPFMMGNGKHVSETAYQQADLSMGIEQHEQCHMKRNQSDTVHISSSRVQALKAAAQELVAIDNNTEECDKGATDQRSLESPLMDDEVIVSVTKPSDFQKPWRALQPLDVSIANTRTEVTKTDVFGLEAGDWTIEKPSIHTYNILVEPDTDRSPQELEAPMVTNECRIVKEHWKPWQQLQPISMPESEESQIFSRENSLKLEEETWQQEKKPLHDNTPRMPVPYIKEADLRMQTRLHCVKQTLNVFMDYKDVARLELDMAWDPLTSCLHVIKQYSKVHMWEHVTAASAIHPASKRGVSQTSLEKPQTSAIIKVCSTPLVRSGQTEKHLRFSDDSLGQNGSLSRRKQSNQTEPMIASSKSQETELNRKTNTSHVSKEVKKKHKESKPLKVAEPYRSPASGSVESRIQQPGKPYDPLDEFIMLRSGKKGLATPSVSDKSPSSNTKVDTPPTPATPDRTSRRRTKTKVITVTISGEYWVILKALSRGAQPWLRVLQRGGFIPASHHFFSFTPSISRFILKQHEKTRTDQGVDGVSSDYCSVLGLHCLVCAADLLTHCCRQSALVYLAQAHEKYASVLKDDLLILRQELFQHNLTLTTSTAHPKVTAMLDVVASWLKRKEVKSPGHDPKILVILKEDIPGLAQYLEDKAGALENIKPLSMAAQDSSSQNIVRCLDQHDLVIVIGSQIREDFPWAQFSMVMDYCYTESSQWQTVCERQSIRFLGLQAVLDVKQAEEHIGDNRTMLTEMTSSAQPSNMLICSQTVTSNKQLLQQLESKYDLTVIERDYSSVGGEGCPHADVVVDAAVGVMLVDVGGLQEGYQLEAVVLRAGTLTQQFSSLWLLLWPATPNPSKLYKFTGNVISNIAKLQAAMTTYSRHQADLSIKCVTCNSYEAVAETVSEIAQLLQNSNPQEKTWISPECTQQEKLLASYPCLNAFSAQLLLKVAPLCELLMMGTEELIARCPQLPRKVLQGFVKHSGCTKLVLDHLHPNHVATEVDAAPEDIHALEPCSEIGHFDVDETGVAYPVTNGHHEPCGAHYSDVDYDYITETSDALGEKEGYSKEEEESMVALLSSQPGANEFENAEEECNMTTELFDGNDVNVLYEATGSRKKKLLVHEETNQRINKELIIESNVIPLRSSDDSQFREQRNYPGIKQSFSRDETNSSTTLLPENNYGAEPISYKDTNSFKGKNSLDMSGNSGYTPSKSEVLGKLDEYLKKSKISFTPLKRKPNVESGNANQRLSAPTYMQYANENKPRLWTHFQETLAPQNTDPCMKTSTCETAQMVGSSRTRYQWQDASDLHQIPEDRNTWSALNTPAQRRAPDFGTQPSDYLKKTQLSERTSNSRVPQIVVPESLQSQRSSPHTLKPHAEQIMSSQWVRPSAPSTPRTPGVASVLPQLSNGSNSTSHRQASMWARWDVPDKSPPMDLSSDEEYDQFMDEDPETRSEASHSQFGLALQPSKRRKLTYQRVPGTTSGQTRLTFL